MGRNVDCVQVAFRILMETFIYTHLDLQVHIALFRNVLNSSDLRKRIIAAATLTGEEGDAERERVNFAFVDARLVR